MFSRQKISKVSQAGGVLGIIALLMVLLTACTFTNDHTTHAGTRQVRITEDEFHIASSVKTFAPGVPYHFVIKNNGRTTHEFMITPLTLSTMNGMSMSDIDQLSLVEVRNITPGQTRTLNYIFPLTTAGTHLQFACHYPGHYEAGMSLNVVVQP